MKTGGNRSISRIRTFDGDVSYIRDSKTTTPAKVNEKKKAKVKKSEVKTKQHEISKPLQRTSSASVAKAKDFLNTNTISNTATLPKIKKDPKKEILPPTIEKNPVNIQSKTPHKITKQNTATIKESIKEELNIVSSNQEIETLLAKESTYDISNNNLEDGVLVTNKRRKKYNLFSEIFKALQSWLNIKTTEITTTKKPIHTMTKAESRIATITYAARDSKHAPKSDHGIVIKKLEKKKRREGISEVVVKSKEMAPTPIWGDASDDVVEMKSEPNEDPPSLHHELISTVETQEVVVMEPKVEVPVDITPEPHSKQDPKVIEAPSPSVKHKIAEQPETPVNVSAKMKSDKATKKKQERKESSTHKFAQPATKKIPISVYLIVIFGASLMGIGATMYWFSSSVKTTEIEIVRIPSLFQVDIKTPVLLTSDMNVIQQLTEMSFTTRETVLLYPAMIDVYGKINTVDTQVFLRALNFRMPGSFTRSITEINFGNHNGTDPFILMRVTNFDTAFAGMLNWELDMSTDLSPLFGMPVTQSHDPHSRTGEQLRTAFFRDTFVSNKSVRVLVNEGGVEKILYSFINPNLILITSDTKTFQAVLKLIKP